MQKHIIHVPHASLYLPDEFWSHIILDKELIKRENEFLCDLLVDTFIPETFENIIKFPYSRMFIDVERFRQDEIETMSKLGMGAVYKKDSNQQIFIDYDESYKESILKSYYDVHHKMLEDKTDEVLNEHNECIIIDLHSYNDELVYKLFKKTNTPDICIGVEERFTDIILLEYTKHYFESLGYTTMINYPYEGSLVPTKFYFSKDTRVKSLMIEINKRIYLNDDQDYQKTKEDMENYFNKILKLHK